MISQNCHTSMSVSLTVRLSGSLSALLSENKQSQDNLFGPGFGGPHIMAHMYAKPAVFSSHAAPCCNGMVALGLRAPTLQIVSASP